jgi:surface antigen
MVFKRFVFTSGSLYRVLLAVVPGLLAVSSVSIADPPPWAPAHGYYKNKSVHKHKHKKHRYQDDDYHHSDSGSDLLPWLAGAATTGYIAGSSCKREAIGAVLGGVVGGVAGSELGKGDHREAATIAGALIGVLVGKSIGRSLDRADQYCTGQTLEYADDRQVVEWQDPDARARYRVTPTTTYEARDGRYCREYTTQATVGGKQQQTYGTACRQPDGSWEVMHLTPHRASTAF